MRIPPGKSANLGITIVGWLLMHFPTQSISAQGLFSISEPRFASYVASRPSFTVTNEAKGQISRSSLRRNEIWLLITIIGDAGTLNYLQDHESLWLQADIWADGKKWDSVQIGMNYDDWERDGKALTSQFQEEGVFTWRTRMKTTK